MWSFFGKNYIINSKESLAEAVKKFGILPFFPNHVKGLSIEEMCMPGMLFGGNHDEGCWEWKGPVIRKRESAYGKFFQRKAGFISLEVLPDFLNYRRSLVPVKSGSTDEMLLEIIRENDSLSSTELKQLIFGKRRRDDPNSLPENEISLPIVTKRKSLETPLQRLQMGGWIIISDFEYKITKSGERYGWGVARYSTPEVTFPEIMEKEITKSPAESLEIMVKELKKKISSAKTKSLLKLLQ